MRNYKIISCVIFMSIGAVLYSQNNTVNYGYDAAGNRTFRTITLQPKPAPAPKDKEEEQQPSEVVYSEALSDIELKIYPNPTDGLLKVEIHNLPEGQTVDIMLYNLSGKLIKSFKGLNKFATIDLSAQPQGTYLMKIRAGEYQTEWKIIKK